MIEPSEEVDQLATEVIGAAIEVHRHLGPGFLESVYEQSLCIELDLQGVPFKNQVPIQLQYKGHPVGEARLDFLVGGQLVVELKAVESLLPIHHAQVINYLKATNKPLGLLKTSTFPCSNTASNESFSQNSNQSPTPWRLGG